MIFSLTTCFGFDSSDADQDQENIEEIVEDEEHVEEPTQEKSEVAVELMIDQIDGLSII